jgi:hypothetical protein
MELSEIMRRRRVRDEHGFRSGSPLPTGRNGSRKRLVQMTETRSKASAGTGSRRTRRVGEVPRFLFTREESARALGMSLSHFQRHVQPHIPCVYSGQLRQYRPEDLRRWAERAALEPTHRSASRA